MDKEFLIQCIQKAYSFELKQVHFGFAAPLPTSAVPLDFLSRITIPLKDSIEITASFDGTVAKREFIAGKDVLFTGKNGWAVSTREGKSRKSISIVFTENYIRAVYSEFVKGELKKNIWYHTSSGMKGLLFHTIQALNELMIDLRHDRFPRAEGLIKTLLAQVIIEMQEDKPLKITKAERTLGQIKDYILTNCHLPINRESISGDLQLNPSYISRLFSERTKETINSFLNKARMRKAAFILKNYDAPMAQVSEQCGFSSTGYFIKVFKKFYGITPGTFRSRERNP